MHRGSRRKRTRDKNPGLVTESKTREKLWKVSLVVPNCGIEWEVCDVDKRNKGIKKG